jgi:hypothetical protein
MKYLFLLLMGVSFFVICACDMLGTIQQIAAMAEQASQ